MTGSYVPLLDALALTLLHSLWQGALVAVVCALGLLGLRRSEERYAAAAAGLLAVFACALLTFMGTLGGARLPAGGDAVSAGTSLLPDFLFPALSLSDLAPWLVGLWGAGAAGHLLWLGLGWWRVRALVRVSWPAPARWQRTLRGLAASLGVAAELRVSVAVTSPLTVGWLRPVVLVPAAVFGRLAPAQLRAVLLHELAHIRRRDYLVNALQVLLEALFFYHPAVWWLSAAVRRERERCCDDLASTRFGDALGYAAALTSLEALRQPPSPLVLSASGGSLMQRIARLLAGRPAPRRPALLLAVVLGLALLAACAARAPGTAAAGGFCLSAHVQTGAHAIPAFNLAAERAMRHALEEQGGVAMCGPDALHVAYHMRFSARTLSWQADLQATDARGVLWRGERRDAVSAQGAFQYTTEANAEGLLREFLASR